VRFARILKPPQRAAPSGCQSECRWDCNGDDNAGGGGGGDDDDDDDAFMTLHADADDGTPTGRIRRDNCVSRGGGGGANGQPAGVHRYAIYSLSYRPASKTIAVPYGTYMSVGIEIATARPALTTGFILIYHSLLRLIRLTDCLD